MRIPTSIFLLFSGVHFSFAQESNYVTTSATNGPVNASDTIRLFLVEPPQPVVVGIPWLLTDSVTWHIPQPYYHYEPQIWPYWNDSLYNFNWISGIVCYFVHITPACGDTYHNNGQLATRVECADSVPHGKTTYWNDHGHKESETTYFEGKMTKSKYYDDYGRVTTISHYNFRGEYDGIQISYDYENDTKYITRYEHGVQLGWQEEYYNGTLTKKEHYEPDGFVDDIIHYHSNGQPSTREKHDYSGNSYYANWNEQGIQTYLKERFSEEDVECEKSWSEEGILTFEQHRKRGQLDGLVLERYEPNTGFKRTVQYENGKRIKLEEYVYDFLKGEEFYHQGIFLYSLQWHAPGDTASYCRLNHQNNEYSWKKWNQEGMLTDVYSIRSNQFSKNGFYTLADTTYLIEVDPALAQIHPAIIKRWVVYHGDTLRQEYLYNTSRHLYLSNEPVLVRNHFVYDTKTGTFVKNGVWSNYNGNFLASAETFYVGVLDGRSVYYQPGNNTNEVREIRNYENGIPHGEWVLYTSIYIYKTMYVHGFRNGKYLICDQTEYPLFVATYQNDTLNGPYEERFTENKFQTKVSGQYLNGQKTGDWIYFDKTFEIIMRGTFTNGVPTGKWYTHYYKIPHKMVRKRIRRPEPSEIPAVLVEQSPLIAT